MPREFPRTRRLGEQIRRELADLMGHALKDPRIAMASITAVEVSRDLAHARVYVTVIGAEAERRATVEALNHAAGVLRRGLGERLVARTVPQLRFIYDESVERGARLESLIDEVVAADRRAHPDDADDERGDH
jgi:ribosome-binding factor A